MICTQCGRENSEGDKYCEQCGAPLEDSSLGLSLGPIAAASSVLVLMGNDVEKSYRLGARAVVGRVESCDISLDDRSISREHARVSRLRDGYVIEDLASASGTLVNGKRIDEAVLLSSGDVVTVGTVDFRFETATTLETEENGSRDLTMVGATVGRELHQEISDGTGERAAEVRSAEPLAPADFPEIESLVETADTQESANMLPASVNDPDVDQVQTENESSKSSLKDTLASVPDPVMESAAPRMPSSTSGTGAFGGEVIQAVQNLIAQSNEAHAKLQEAEAARSQLWQELVESRKVELRHDTVKQILQAAPAQSTRQDELERTKEMVDNLLANPKDVEVLMKFGQQGAPLAALLSEYAELRDLVERLSQETRES
jgi:pSer/pThr/pTyr-binding forkhead associated (FHA) protein